MTQDMTRASSPVADSGHVRFTVFFEVRGPQVFEISAQVLARHFGAKGYSAAELLEAFHQHEDTIVNAARAYHGPPTLGAQSIDSVFPSA